MCIPDTTFVPQRTRNKSRRKVTRVTVIPTQVAHTQFMDRVTNEAEYVLEVLHQMRQEVIANPQWFDRDAVERIDKAIASLENITLEVKAA